MYNILIFHILYIYSTCLISHQSEQIVKINTNRNFETSDKKYNLINNQIILFMQLFILKCNYYFLQKYKTNLKRNKDCRPLRERQKENNPYPLN